MSHEPKSTQKASENEANRVLHRHLTKLFELMIRLLATKIETTPQFLHKGQPSTVGKTTGAWTFRDRFLDLYDRCRFNVHQH